MKKSISENSIFYLLFNIINMIFPFLTSIYAARILTPETIGTVLYARNIVSYFSVLAFLGIPTYGVREISRVRNNRKKLDSLFTELFFINMVSTCLFSVLYYAMVLILPQFQENKILYIIVGLVVISNALNTSWLFDGLEEFKFISISNASFKIIAFLTLIALVRNENGVLLYAVIDIIGATGNWAFNLVYSRKKVRFVKMKKNGAFKHVKPILLLLVVNIAIELYSLIDVTMLGYLVSKSHVAFYQYASKINHVLIQLTNTITVVLVPRLSFEFSRNNTKEFNRLLTKGFIAIVMVAVPVIIGVQFTANYMLNNIYGIAFEASGYVERVLCIVVLISPIGYLLGSRVMLIANNIKAMVLCVTVGAITNVIGNLCLITKYEEYGAAIASVISEMVVMVLYVYRGRKVFKLEPYSDSMKKITVASSLMTGYLLLLNCILGDSWLKIIVEIIGAAGIYAMVLLLTKEKVFASFASNRVKRNRKM